MAEALHPDEAAAFPPMWAELGAKDADGRASGAAVAGLLRAANVPTESLQRVWALVDTAGVGSLDEAQFYAAMRYVALCQRDVSAEVSAARLGSFAGMPLVPNLADFDPAAPPSPVLGAAAAAGGSQQLEWGQPLDDAPLSLGGESSPTPSERSVSSVSGSVRSIPGPFTPDASPWAVSAQERERHVAYFDTLAQADGQTGEPALPMATAIQVLRMSEQPDEVLAAVWDLATFQQTVPAALTASEFVAAMHILTVLREKPQATVPSSLPPELAETAVAPGAAGAAAPAPEPSPAPAADGPTAAPSADGAAALADEPPASEAAEKAAAARAEEEARTEEAARAEEAAREEEAARLAAEEAVMAKSRLMAEESMEALAQTAPSQTVDVDSPHQPSPPPPQTQRDAAFEADFADAFDGPSAARSDSVDPFGSEAGSQNLGELDAAPVVGTVSRASSDADLDAAFGIDGDDAGSDPFADASVGSAQAAAPWPPPPASADPVSRTAVEASTSSASTAPWASPAAPEPADDAGSERLRKADSDNLELQSRIAKLSAESTQLKERARMESMAVEREAENEALRAQLSQLTQEVAENTRLYQQKVKEGSEGETLHRTLQDEVEALEIEVHRQQHAIQRQTEINTEDATRREELLEVKEKLAAQMAEDKEQAEHTKLAKEVKTMEVNLEYEKMAADKLAAEVERLRTKLSEQAASLQARRESYEGHARRVHQLKDERLVIEAQSTQAEFGAATVAAQKERLGPTLPAGAAAGDGGSSSSSSSNPFASSEEDDGGFGDSGLGAAFGDAGAPAQLVDDPFADADAAAGVAAPFGSPAGPFESTPNPHPSPAGPFSSPAPQASSPNPFSAATDGGRGRVSAPADDPFAAAETDADPFAEPFSVPAKNPFSS